MSLLNIAVQALQINGKFPKILRLESRDLQFNGNEAIEAAMEEQQIEREVPSSNLYRILRADKAKITAQFNQKLFQLPQETSMENGFEMLLWQIKKLCLRESVLVFSYAFY